MKKNLIAFLTPVLLGILIFASNFLNTRLFHFGENNFAVWFVLSVLCFATGWFLIKNFGWQTGGKVVFAVIVSVSVLSIILITFFREYFAANELLVENLILYTLRNVVLGSMAYFGMAVVEVMRLQKDLLVNQEKLRIYEEGLRDAKKESELEIKDAKIQAQNIIVNAELEAKDIILKKERIIGELKEFIQAEKELIKKYEQLK
jgi:hypothetical protein